MAFANRVPRRPAVRRAGAAAVVIGCVMLAARPVLLASSRHPRTTLVVMFCGLGALGLVWPSLWGPTRPTSRPAIVVLAIGIATFAVARLLGGGHTPAPPSPAFIALNSLAAVAEEAFFRRLVYGLLVPSGPVYTIAGSAVLFAAVHVTTYGYWVVPIDIGAGLLLGWQRWSSSTWLVPAATHVAANIFVVI